MSKPLTQGEKNRRANLRSLKAVGRKNAKIRAAAKVASFLAHVDRNNTVAEQAAAARARRIAAHESRNAESAQVAQWNRDAKKAVEAREAAGIPSIATMLADNNNDTMVVAELLLGRAA